jgi:hypothetical protein
VLDEAEGVLGPFAEVLDEILLAEEVGPAAGHADDAHPLVDEVELGLVLEAAGPDVDLEAELGEFLGELEDVDDLAAGVGGAQGGLGGDITMRGYQAEARQEAVRIEGGGDDKAGGPLPACWPGMGAGTERGGRLIFRPRETAGQPPLPDNLFRKQIRRGRAATHARLSSWIASSPQSSQ